MALRNVIQRRNHKERSQPSHRKKLGLLEKHKDYIQRARDHREKRDRLQRLREKAEMRNKDEFYFGMISSKTNEGVHVQERGAAVLDNDTALVLKTQDAGYLRNKVKDERKQIDTLVKEIGPSMPVLRAAWVDEKEGRREALAEAGLLAAIGSSKDRKGKAKAKDDPSSSTARGSARTLRQAMESGSSLANAGKRTVWCDDVKQVAAFKPASSSKAQTAASQDEDDDDDDDDEDDREDAAGARERHIGYLTGLLGQRQGRLRMLLQALEKVNFQRSPNVTKERKR